VRRNIPVVCIDRKPKENNEVAIIESDNLDGGYQATSLLIEKGCKNIVILKSEKDTSTNLDRFEGYRKAIEESSNHLNEELIISLKKTHFNYAKDAINKLIEKNIKFDGIFA